MKQCAMIIAFAFGNSAHVAYCISFMKRAMHDADFFSRFRWNSVPLPLFPPVLHLPPCFLWFPLGIDFDRTRSWNRLAIVLGCFLNLVTLSLRIGAPNLGSFFNFFPFLFQLCDFSILLLSAAVLFLLFRIAFVLCLMRSHWFIVAVCGAEH
jgi:hypothetical protein